MCLPSGFCITSKLNHKTEEVCENLYLPDAKGVIRKLHSVLTYKMENRQIGCINRDENAVNNMIKIVNHYLDKKERLLKYRRDYDLEKGELKAETKQKVITSIKNDTKNGRSSFNQARNECNYISFVE